MPAAPTMGSPVILAAPPADGDDAAPPVCEAEPPADVAAPPADEAADFRLDATELLDGINTQAGWTAVSNHLHGGRSGRSN